MSCTFFGSRDTPDSCSPNISKAILSLISDGVTDFYVGNNGNFDYLSQIALLNAKKQHKIRVHIFLSYINEKPLCGAYELTEFCEELATVPKKFAIYKRNALMLKRARFVVTNAHRSVGNSRTWLNMAITQGKSILYI